MSKNTSEILNKELNWPTIPSDLQDALNNWLETTDAAEAIDKRMALRHYLFTNSPVNTMPVERVMWVPIDMVQPNDYNPNSVAKVELQLLYTSIAHDGYTMPVVTIWDEAEGKFIIVDGFHRYFTMKNNADIRERTHGRLPIVVIEKDINDRMASTVRHNRARGKHSVQGMSSMVFSMLENGWTDAEICNELGMSAPELVRIKHVTGFSKLFADAEYSAEYAARPQVKERIEYLKNHPEETDIPY